MQENQFSGLEKRLDINAYNYTRNFIKDHEITPEFIREKLYIICNEIKENNKIHLYDINIICEEIFGKILNDLFGYNLYSTTAVLSPNYIAVDLIDTNAQVVFQITTQSTKKKIKDTLLKYSKKTVEAKEGYHIFFLFLCKHENLKNIDFSKKEPLLTGQIFSYKDDIYDVDTIINCLETRKNQRLNNLIYRDINMVTDSGRLHSFNIIRENNSLEKKRICDGGKLSSWEQGYGDVKLWALIPKVYPDELTCELEFRSSYLHNGKITFGEQEIVEKFFVNEEQFIEIHNKGTYKDEMYMQLGNVLVEINANTAYHLFLLFQKLENEYDIAQGLIDDILGTNQMKKMGKWYVLREISIREWNAVVSFARHHHYENPVASPWNIFGVEDRLEVINIKPNDRSDIKTGQFATICLERGSGISDMRLLWKPGFDDGIPPYTMNNFDNIHKWKADFTLKWFNEKLLYIAKREFGI